MGGVCGANVSVRGAVEFNDMMTVPLHLSDCRAPGPSRRYLGVRLRETGYEGVAAGWRKSRSSIVLAQSQRRLHLGGGQCLAGETRSKGSLAGDGEVRESYDKGQKKGEEWW